MFILSQQSSLTCIYCSTVKMQRAKIVRYVQTEKSKTENVELIIFATRVLENPKIRIEDCFERYHTTKNYKITFLRTIETYHRVTYI